MKISKKRYLQGLSLVVIFLAIIRAAFPHIADSLIQDGSRDTLNVEHSPQTVTTEVPQASGEQSATAYKDGKDTAEEHAASVRDEVDTVKSSGVISAGRTWDSRFFTADGRLVKNRIKSVPHFGRAFPDANDVQLQYARKYGVKAVADRREAERRKAELVYVGSNPYFYVDRLRSSIPYLVPRASMLLQDIGKAFMDSLQIKDIPLHKIIVTSLLRSQADVAHLRGHNGNATQNSCHLYGTTFDVCYNRYKTVETPDEPRRAVRNDTLKWVLSEVLNDQRCQGRCLVKYEVHQGCFHITVK